MYIAPLDTVDLWRDGIHRAAIFSDSIAWISNHAAETPEGIHELGRAGWFVNVQSYHTLEADRCVWENHTHTVDLQYIIDGIEGIDVAAVSRLGEPTIVKPESDTQKFNPPAGETTRLVMESGMFAILMPGEAHRPKVAIGPSVHVRKLVVKIPIDLIG